MLMLNRFKIFGCKIILKVLPPMAFFKLNNAILRLMGFKVHSSSRIWSSLKVNGVVKVIIGENTFIGDACTLTGGDSIIKIGDFCDIHSQERAKSNPVKEAGSNVPCSAYVVNGEGRPSRPPLLSHIKAHRAIYNEVPHHYL